MQDFVHQQYDYTRKFALWSPPVERTSDPELGNNASGGPDPESLRLNLFCARVKVNRES